MADEATEKDAGTAEAILGAAETLFAAQGFAATTIKQIGKEAGLNPALIYYYFGSKEELYRQLLQRLFFDIAQRGMSRLAGIATPADGVRGVIGVQSEMLREHPSIPRLMARELADYGAAHAQQGIAQLSATVFARLCDIIRAGQAAGVFRPEMDPRYAAISTVSLVPYFHIFKPAVGILLGDGQEPTAEQMIDYARHAAEFALAALTVKGDGT